MQNTNQNIILGKILETKMAILSSKDREDYIFNTQLSVASNLLDKLKRGGLKLQLVGEASLDPFVDRFDSAVAGWTCTLSVEIENDMLML